MRRKAFIFSTLLSLLVIVCFRGLLFGHGPTWRGGEIGRRIDNSIKSLLFRWAEHRHMDNFRRSLGYSLPACKDKAANKVGTPVLTQAWLSATLLQARRRQEAIDAYTSASNATCPSNLARLQPVFGDWYSPVETKSTLMFDVETMEDLVATEFEWLYSKVYFHLTETEKVQLWAICAVYHMGGAFLAPGVEVEEFWSREDCHGHMMWFHPDENATSIELLVATKKHPRIRCMLEALRSRLLERPSTGVKISWLDILELATKTIWNEVKQSCEESTTEKSEIASYLTAPRRPQQDPVNSALAPPRFNVRISEPLPDLYPLATETKYPWSKKLDDMGCSPGWICQRCLRMPWRGNLRACGPFCRRCYEESLCQTPRSGDDDLIIDVVVVETEKSPLRRIPRIVHQTWFEELTTDRYPHLQRMQHSWKASGWGYRFYTDTQARSYIANHYPPLFVDAYDALLPGAFKADLFRLLVLLKDGGIYSDIDVQLETRLDSFITANLSFFVPRDCPIDYWADSNFCLWNGLMGAAPGHPVVAQAVEDVVNRVLNRQDYYDIESSLCRKDAGVEVWKLRTLPILLLTGPCALGMSLNTALHHDNALEGFNWGWLPEAGDWGDALLLVADRYDMGELRFTDLGRNLLVASTNQDRVAKSPIQTEAKVQPKKSEHYSQSESEIVGEHGTYKDDQTINRKIRLVVRHSFV